MIVNSQCIKHGTCHNNDVVLYSMLTVYVLFSLLTTLKVLIMSYDQLH